MSIKLKIGGVYKDRRGLIVSIDKVNDRGGYQHSHPFRSSVGGRTYREDGTYSGDLGAESANDLIEVVSEPKLVKETFMATHKKTVQWGVDKSVYSESDAQQQASKGLEEFAELVGNVSRIKEGDDVAEDERESVKDDIGDIMVCLTHVAKFYGLTLKECYQHAYNEIKDRQGRMVNGKFVKDA